MGIIFECLIKYKIYTHDLKCKLGKTQQQLCLIRNSFTFYLWLMTRENMLCAVNAGRTHGFAHGVFCELLICMYGVCAINNTNVYLQVIVSCPFIFRKRLH